MISCRRCAGQQQFTETDPCGSVKLLLVDLVPIGMRDRTQPAHQRQIHSRANAFEDALKKVVVRRYETRVDDTPRSVNDLFTWLRSEFADCSDPPIANADRASGTHRIVWQASENTLRVADQHRGHVATPISLNARGAARRPGPCAAPPSQARKAPPADRNGHLRSTEQHGDRGDIVAQIVLEELQQV